MIKILILGDAHIHDREDEIPREIERIIYDNKPYDIAIYTGDFTDRDVYEWFKSLAPKTFEVCGNMDYLELPEYQVINITNNLSIGVIHGHQVRPRGNIVKLTQIAKQLNVKILTIENNVLKVLLYELNRSKNRIESTLKTFNI